MIKTEKLTLGGLRRAVVDGDVKTGSVGLERMQKNNRSDRKHGTFRKYGLPPIDTPEETSAIPFKKMKPKNTAAW